MELRVLEYFLAVCQNGTITQAAGSLHLSQPTLSRQLKELEEELGVKLFERGSKSVTLTAEGKILRRRAQEIVELARLAKEEVANVKNNVFGEVNIGAGETKGMRFIASAAKRFGLEHPQVRFNVTSGDSTDIIEKLDDGLYDFALLFEPIDHTKYDCVRIPVNDKWGVLVPKDDALVEKGKVSAADLKDKPLIISRQAEEAGVFDEWFGDSKRSVVASYNLIYNGALMVEASIGYAFSLQDLVHASGDDPLRFLPLDPPLEAEMRIVWKKGQVFSQASSEFLETLKRDLKESKV